MKAQISNNTTVTVPGLCARPQMLNELVLLDAIPSKVCHASQHNVTKFEKARGQTQVGRRKKRMRKGSGLGSLWSLPTRSRNIPASQNPEPPSS